MNDWARMMSPAVYWIRSDTGASGPNDGSLGPPTQSIYSDREKRERTSVAVGIALGILVLFAVPLCLLYYATWRRRQRKKRGQQPSLAGTTAVSENEKGGASQFERTGCSTLTTTLRAPEDAIFTEAEIAQWQEIQRGRTETELERLKRDSTSPLNTYSIPKVTKPISSDETLGLDKSSYLRNLPIASSPTSAASGITVLPTQFMPLGKPRLERESSGLAQKCSGGGECVNPWDVEHEPNPVIFSHLPRGNRLGHEERSVPDQNEEPSSPSNVSSEDAMDVQEHQSVEQFQYDASHIDDARGREGSHHSSLSAMTSDSSPTSSSDSQDSSDPLLPQRSRETGSHSHSPPMLPGQHLAAASGGRQRSSHNQRIRICPDCSKTFTTTGQLNAHIHRKHVRRYSCDICSSSFHLKADLKRHESTVHRTQLPSDTTRGFRCPNQGCPTPDKIFPRRDNCRRHAERCAKRFESDDSPRASE